MENTKYFALAPGKWDILRHYMGSTPYRARVEEGYIPLAITSGKREESTPVVWLGRRISDEAV